MNDKFSNTLNQVRMLPAWAEGLVYFTVGLTVAFVLYLVFRQIFFSKLDDELDDIGSEVDAESESIPAVSSRKNLSSFEEARGGTTSDSDSNRESQILLVDDDEDFLDALKDLLSRDYEVRTTNCAIEAVDIVQNATVDLLISDFVMPKVNGIQLVSKVRAIPGFSNLPIIILTGTDDELILNVLRSTPRLVLFQKSEDINNLLEVVAEQLGEKKVA